MAAKKIVKNDKDAEISSTVDEIATASITGELDSPSVEEPERNFGMAMDKSGAEPETETTELQGDSNLLSGEPTVSGEAEPEAQETIDRNESKPTAVEAGATEPRKRKRKSVPVTADLENADAKFAAQPIESEDGESEITELDDSDGSSDGNVEEFGNDEGVTENTVPAGASSLEATDTSYSVLPLDARPKRPNFIVRLFKVMFGRSTMPVLPTDEVGGIEPGNDAEPDISQEDLIALISMLESEMSTKIDERTYREAENLRLQQVIDQDTASAAEIENFIISAERSFHWRVQKTMSRNLQSARTDLAGFQSTVENVSVPEDGRLIQLRKHFHLTVLVAFVVAGLVAGFATLYPILYSIRAPEWLQTIIGSDAFTSILVALFVAAAGIIYLFRRFVVRKKWPIGQILIFTALSIALFAFVVGDRASGGQLSRELVPFLQQNIWQILSACGSVFGFVTLVALIIYYSGWGKFRREVQVQLASLESVIEGYVHSQKEIRRLELLYAQTAEWLELIAHSLYRPWRTHPDWEGSREFEKHFSTFPFALRLAQVQETQGSKMTELERLVGARLLVQGWRADAFDDLVKNVGSELGLHEGTFTIDTLDADLPHQTNNSRGLLKRFLEQSAKNQQAGILDMGKVTSPEEGEVGAEKKGPSDRYLVEVARERLLSLVDETQSIVLTAAKPRVEQIKDDPLRELRDDSAGIEEFDPTESWDEFLTESLGVETVAQPPMGILNFSEFGRRNRAHENPHTYIISPKRISSDLPRSDSTTVDVVPVGDERPRSVEIIARVDVVGPLPYSHIAVLGEQAHTSPTKSENVWATGDQEATL